MNYQKCITYLNTIESSKNSFGLELITELLARIGDPQHHLKVLHIAGTNGKGSVSHLLKNVFMVQGYNIGLYNSPYILSPRETILYNDASITQEDFEQIASIIIGACISMVQEGFAHPSAFECITALAFKYFEYVEVDYAIIEVGLGGLNDATNVFPTPLLSIITTIDYDHTQFLGTDLESIAKAKAGIIKPKVPVVIAPNNSGIVFEVLKKKALELEAPIVCFPMGQLKVTSFKEQLSGMTFDISTPYCPQLHLTTALIGAHQFINISVALSALHILNTHNGIVISDQSIKTGIERTTLPSRCEYLKEPQPILIDGAHNLSGIKSFIQVLSSYCKDMPITFLFGILSDKDVSAILKEIAPYSDTVFITKPLSPRAMPIEELRLHAKDYFTEIHPFESAETALQAALNYSKKHSTLLCCVGSLYLSIPVRSWITGETLD